MLSKIGEPSIAALVHYAARALGASSISQLNFAGVQPIARAAAAAIAAWSWITPLPVSL